MPLIRGSFFITLSAAIALLLGLVHLLYTFHGSKLHPRDPDLIARMKTDSPRITSQTTIWRVWIGINATHSLCLILFGAVYGYLAMCHSEVLFNSAFLLGLGLLLLLAFVALSYLYFFRTPLLGVILATVFYLLGIFLKGK
jgi:hypothetical protein